MRFGSYTGLLIVGLLVLSFSAGAAPTETTFMAERLGKIRIYAPEGPPTSVVLLISGSEGWDEDALRIARELRGWGALVAGVNSTDYLAAQQTRGGTCTDASADLADLGRVVQQRAGITSLQIPLLVGYGSGATLAYVTAVQAPPGTFAGIISLGFCATLPSMRPWCPGAGLETTPATNPGSIRFQPAPGLRLPWLVLHGEFDESCSVATTQTFSGRIASAKFVLVPQGGHGRYTEGNWLVLFRDAYLKLVTASTEPPIKATDVSDLPLVEVPAHTVGGKQLAVLLTGDGGWAGLDRELSSQLSAAGMPVVALSTLRYFWAEQKPEVAARDLDRIIRHYLRVWHKQQVVLIGYSFGANVLPFMVSRLPLTTRNRITSLNLLAPSTHTGFEIHVADWVPGSTPAGQPIQPEFKRLGGLHTLCLFGAMEQDSLCPNLPVRSVRAIRLPGDHHFDGDYPRLAREIIAFAGR